MKTRLEIWEKEKFIDLFVDYTNESINTRKSIDNFLKSINYESKVLTSQLSLIENAKELIFDMEDGQTKIHVISQELCLKTFKLKHHQILQFIFKGDDVFNQVRDTIAIALACDIPVYPNTAELETELLKYYKNILEFGFTAPGEDGKRVELRATNTKNLSDFKIENLNKINTSQFWSALDLLILKENLQDEFLKLGNAQRTLNYLEIAISSLEQGLNNCNRNENELQRILTANPILFGIEYASILPKHKLGAEYEMDYALEKYSGLKDIVEIESSNLKLFTKQGNPTKELVHAEQQIIDWMNWIEQNNAYANSKIPGFISPKGYIVIGTNRELTEKDKLSLIRRNKLFNEAITILTYDDLLIKAKVILDILKR